jgi:hypothetical protein
MVIYYPLGIHAARGWKPTREALLWWMTLFAKKGTNVWVPVDVADLYTPQIRLLPRGS